MKTPEQIALEQREYWKSVRKENKDHTFGQQVPGEPGLPEDPFTISPAAWQEYWNLQLPGDIRE